jgi:anti-sigma B factor antagonist
VEELTIETVSGTPEGVRVLKLTGPFILRTMFDFQSLVRSGDAQTTIIDLTGVPYIDSAALGCLVGVHVSCQRLKRQYALAGASERVRSLFAMCGVDSILVNYPTLDQAQRALIGTPTSA